MKHHGLFLAAAGLLSFVALPRAGEPSDKDIARLIFQLGSDRYIEREKAEEALLALKQIPDRLRKACRSTDAETRSRARRIVAVFDGRLVALPIARVERLAKEGRFDEAVEHAVRWEGLDPSGKNLVPLAALAKRLRRKACEQIERILPPGDRPTDRLWENGLENGVALQRELFPLYSSNKSLAIEIYRKSLLRGAGVDVREKTSMEVFVVSSGPATVQCVGTSHCVVFACEAFKSKCAIDGIIIADGDVDLDHLGQASVDFSIIIARGDIKLPRTLFVGNSVLLAGGKISLHKESKGMPKPGVVMRENDLSGLGIIKFFEPKSVGIEVGAGTDGVQVRHLRKETPFAKVLSVGDVVTVIDRARTPSPEVFRRVLRKALANVGSDMAVSIRRDGVTRDVKIPIEP